METVTTNGITIIYHKGVYKFKFEGVKDSYGLLITDYSTSECNFHDFLSEGGSKQFDDENYEPNKDEKKALEEISKQESNQKRYTNILNKLLSLIK